VPTQPAAQGGSAQQISGQSGVAVEAPKPNAAPTTQGSGQNAPQTSGQSAPVPAPPKATPKDSVMSVEEAEALVEAGDTNACREAGRKLRLAGVAVPPPLLALTALDPKFFEAQPQTETQTEPQTQPQ
jgi:hypothetical protein